MQTNPTFVRLTDAASRGALADIGGSGWGISGNDVVPFPDDAEAARYVRQKIRLGVLEEASQAEHEEAHPEAYSTGDDIQRVMFVQDTTPHQEANVLEAAARRAKRLQTARANQTQELYGEDTGVPSQAGVAGGVRKFGAGIEGGFATPGVPSPSEAELQKRLVREQEPDTPPAIVDERPYEDWSKKELVAEAKNRDLDTKGTVAELVERLEADDAGEAEDENDD